MDKFTKIVDDYDLWKTEEGEEDSFDDWWQETRLICMDQGSLDKE